MAINAYQAAKRDGYAAPYQPSGYKLYTENGIDLAVAHRLFDEGRYFELCDRYCHEGMGFDFDGKPNEHDGLIHGGICSFEATGDTQDAVLRSVAEHIIQDIANGMEGC